MCSNLNCNATVLLLLCCRALKFCGSGGPPHVKLVIEWDHKTKEWYAVYINIWSSVASAHVQMVAEHTQCSSTAEALIVSVTTQWFSAVEGLFCCYMENKFFCVSFSLFGSIQEEVVKDAESVRNQQQQHLQQHSCTLDECFQLYTKEEQVRLKAMQLASQQ